MNIVKNVSSISYSIIVTYNENFLNIVFYIFIYNDVPIFKCWDHLIEQHFVTKTVVVKF